jgi:putative flippase GtrA
MQGEERMNPQWQASSVFNRWLAYNLVGAMGIAVQMTALFTLTSCLGLGYLLATGIAVELAVLHNFFWHEHWTWADRIEGLTGSMWRRLVWFHLTNGALSLAGNLLLMRLFVEKMRLNYLEANALAIALSAVANFIAGNCLVFRGAEAPLKKGREI